MKKYKSDPVIKGAYRIPVSSPDLSKKEEKYLLDAYRSTWLSSAGNYLVRFENAYAKIVSRTRYALAVNSGTSALHLALLACDIREGDEVIVPTFTMIASANSVRYCGAKPIFIDADILTYNINVKKIEAKITKNTKAIMVVHIYGLPVDMDPVLFLAKKYNLWVIEDAAEAHGAEYKGRRVGSIGHIAGFSLYGNKIITTGEGGMVTTNSKKLAQKVALLRDHAFSNDVHFQHQEIGYSYNMSNLQAAVGLAQVERFTELLERKKKNADLYTSLLTGVRGLTLPCEPQNATRVHWMYGILVDKKVYGVSRDQLRNSLAKKGIETRSFFIPMHLQKPYKTDQNSEDFSVSELLSEQGVYLPSSSILTQKTIHSIASYISHFAKKRPE